MTVGKVTVTRDENRTGWFRVAFCSLPNFIGVTSMELLIREEHLRKFREAADRALSNQPPLDYEDFFKKED